MSHLYQRTYKIDNEVHYVNFKAVKKVFQRCFKDWEQKLERLFHGEIIETPECIYKIIRDR